MTSVLKTLIVENMMPRSDKPEGIPDTVYFTTKNSIKTNKHNNISFNAFAIKINFHDSHSTWEWGIVRQAIQR